MVREWCKFNPHHKQKDPNFESILDFYLWACPVKGTAYLAKSFSDYGWVGGNQFKALKRNLLSASSIEIPFEATTPEKLNETLAKHGQEEKRSCSEVIVIVNPEGEIETLLRSIRNALAHGSFLVEKKRNDNDFFYFFENKDPKNDYKLRTRVVLKSSTLKAWKKEIEKGYIKPKK